MGTSPGSSSIVVEEHCKAILLTSRMSTFPVFLRPIMLGLSATKSTLSTTRSGLTAPIPTQKAKTAKAIPTTANAMRMINILDMTSLGTYILLRKGDKKMLVPTAILSEYDAGIPLLATA